MSCADFSSLSAQFSPFLSTMPTRRMLTWLSSYATLLLSLIPSLLFPDLLINRNILLWSGHRCLLLCILEDEGDKNEREEDDRGNVNHIKSLKVLAFNHDQDENDESAEFLDEILLVVGLLGELVFCLGA